MRKKLIIRNGGLTPSLLFIAIVLISSVLLATSQSKMNLTPSKFITSAFMVSTASPPIINVTGEITGGGRNLTSGVNIRIKLTVGQAIVGVVNNSNLKVCFGFLCKPGASNIYSINFTGQLNYSNGTAVINKPFTATIIHEPSGTYKTVTNNTDSNGYFLTVIENIPNLSEEDFKVKFYLADDIEATYECTYDPGTEKCCSSGPPCP